MNHLSQKKKESLSDLPEMMGVHLANLYSLMLRLQNFHWNVEGPQFRSAHTLFEEQYTELWKQVDIAAERIRMRGERPPATLKEFYELSEIADREQPQDLEGMLQDLISCTTIVRDHCAETLKASGLRVDEVTSDMLITQMALLEKAIWMYQSSTASSPRSSVKAGGQEERASDSPAKTQRPSKTPQPLYEQSTNMQSSPVPRV